MSFLEAYRDLGPTIDVRIGVIEERGNPKIQEGPCDTTCGGVLRYTQGFYVNLWDGNRVEVESVWAYRCTKECGVTLFLPEVGTVIEKYIDEAWTQVGFRPHQFSLVGWIDTELRKPYDSFL